MFGLEKLIEEKIREIDAKRTAEHAQLVKALGLIHGVMVDVKELLSRISDDLSGDGR